jgi:peptide/nickel transport system ATP-binding protein
MTELLRFHDWSVGFAGSGTLLLRDVELTVAAGESVALVGPSGSGKTLLARAALGLLPPAAVARGQVLWRGMDPACVQPGGWAAVRGRGPTWLPQEPLAGLNPLRTIGAHITEAAQIHLGLDRAAARHHAAALLAELHLPDAERLLDAWPHELSGGMRQRALLAAALACNPELLIADEPTSSLDTTVQRELLAVLDAARRQRGMALLFITHDRDLVPLVAGRCLEIREGRVVEVAVACAPTASSGSGKPGAEAGAQEVAVRWPALSARGIVVRHGAPGSHAAVADVDLDLWAGRAVGLVGESAAGKSSLARALAGHLVPAAGEITVAGSPLDRRVRGAAARANRRRVQMLFQDAGASLNPRQRVGEALAEAAGRNASRPVEALLEEVGLEAGLAARYPHALSGGQRQRVALARCLAADPAVLVADEPTSALDGAARRQVLELLAAVMRKRGLAVLLVTHDLDAALAFCDEIVVMHGGVVVERAPAGAVLRHPHSRQLLDCRPSVLASAREWRPAVEPGTAGAPSRSRPGCPSAGRCPLQNASCFKELPPLRELSRGHWLRCPPAAELPSPQFIDTL